MSDISNICEISFNVAVQSSINAIEAFRDERDTRLSRYCHNPDRFVVSIKDVIVEASKRLVAAIDEGSAF